MEPKERQESGKDKNEITQEGPDSPENSSRSDSDFYKRTFIGTGAPKSDENFDQEHRQANERDIEDRDNNDGDANTENNF